MNICSVIIHVRPERAPSVTADIEKLQGAEVHGGAEDGKLIVTVEHDDDSVMSDTVNGFTSIDGVLNASMIYHHYEEFEVEQGVV
ncbi:MAG: chaperone NapD [Gammaproteobacteria bacterium]|uniref:Chaperone NapD n=1 Tax=Candidatus Thiopontia autotrophica TaxID=2841688 RepID=A0A8J6P7F3_9GAMM|nr:chaperone NapD [Candidatus Thiopontia autotrophica]MBL6969494.1 chaperone NapD [Gammaproteobacteria bacterium]